MANVCSADEDLYERKGCDACDICQGTGESTWYKDDDGDGWGDSGSTEEECDPVAYTLLTFATIDSAQFSVVADNVKNGNCIDDLCQ